MDGLKQIVKKLVVLDLSGLNGNAFSLMGAFKEAARKQGTPKEEVTLVLEECMTGSYCHLLSTLMANTTVESPNDGFEVE